MTRKQKITSALAALGAGGALLLTGCSAATEEWNDAPVDHKVDRPAVVGSMPDGFANWAEKCDDFGNLLVTTRDGQGGGKAVTVIPDKEACAPWDKGADGWKKTR